MIFRGVMLCTAGLLAGCPDSGGEMAANVTAARVFYAQPAVEQMMTFRQHGLAEQLDLYFYGNQVRHPPAIYLARCFALSGERAVDLLRAKLSSKNDDLTIRDISALLATIDAMGKYDVSEDAELMSALRAQVANMQDQGWRDTAERKIASIESSQYVAEGNAPECGPPPVIAGNMNRAGSSALCGVSCLGAPCKTRPTQFGIATPSTAWQI